MEEDHPRMAKPGNSETPLTATAVSDPPPPDAHTLTLEFRRFLSQDEWREVVEIVKRWVPYVQGLRADAVAACPPPQEERCADTMTLLEEILGDLVKPLDQRVNEAYEEVLTALSTAVSPPPQEEEYCRCADPRPLVPGAKCRRCHRWTVVVVSPPPQEEAASSIGRTLALQAGEPGSTPGAATNPMHFQAFTLEQIAQDVEDGKSTERWYPDVFYNAATVDEIVTLALAEIRELKAACPPPSEARGQEQSMKLDAKFYGSIIKAKDNTTVPDDEYVVFLAKDNAFAAVLPLYLQECIDRGCDAEQIAAVRAMHERLTRWRAEHPERLKNPDAAGERLLVPGVSPVPAATRTEP